MSDPFLIEGPAVISFSGGRTSAYMLWRVCVAWDWRLPTDVHVLFADTGKERQETYAFVDECARTWGVEVHRVERAGQFTQLITDKKFLPNPIARFCTQELKLRPMRDWMLARGYEHWWNVVGIRADEPRRVAKIRAANADESRQFSGYGVELPLADAGITLAHVNEFWRDRPWGLDLKAHEGNCDLCFLKGYDKLKNIVRDRPDLAEWWAQQEERIGGTFRNDRPSYRAMLNQPDLFKDGQSADLIECYCTD